MNWKSIIATALITGAVTISTGMFLFWWQTEKPELTYNSIQSIPFDDASNKLFIQQIEIDNSGGKTADDVVLVISFAGETIQRSQITIDDAIYHRKQSNENSIQLYIDSLNPGEGANISVLYQSADSQSTRAAISLRAKGITGKLIGSDNENRETPMWIALVAAYAGVISFLISTKRGRTSISLVTGSLLSGRPLGGNQKDKIASVLSLCGYPEKAKEYLNSGADRKYWVEADFLSAEALLGDEKLKRDTIKVLELISEVPNIAPFSKAITYYNIARLYEVLNPRDKNSSENLDFARKLDEREVENRLSRDPVFLLDNEFNNEPEHSERAASNSA